MTPVRVALIVVCAVALGCGGPPSAVDAGMVVDAGVASDSGTLADAGATRDAGTSSDAGDVSDSGLTTDAGLASDGGEVTDAGTFDGGVAMDGGAVADAGTSTDGGAQSDAGTSLDAGTNPDAGVSLDAGASTDGGARSDAGVGTDAGASTDGGARPDAGVGTDAGASSDGGARPDAGVGVDAGASSDGGAIPDAGSGADAGPSFDAGANPDAGTTDAGLCSSVGPWAPHLVISLLDGGALPSPLFTRDRLDVRVLDLPPCREVVLEFRLDAGFVSAARFTSDTSGVVSTARDAPVVGAWSGVRPDALFFSMSNGGVSSPTVHQLTITGRWDGGAAFSSVVSREVLPPGTTITSFRETTADGLYADFYRPPGAGPFPGVVVFGGSEGGLGGGVLTGSGLVRDGFAVLSIAYWGVSGKPSGMSRIPLETFQRAVQRLRALPDVKPNKIAVLGVSRGGEGALLAGASFPTDVQAVVSLVGSGYAWAAPGSSTVSTWTLDGGDVPFIPWPAGSNTTITRDGGINVTFSAPFFQAGVVSAADAGLLSRAETRVESINGPVLLLAAGDDGIWPSCLLTDSAWNRLVDAGHVAARGDVYRCFAGAGHSINPSRVGFPLVDLIDRGTGTSRTGYGGSAEADDAANRELWVLIRDFLTFALQ